MQSKSMDWFLYDIGLHHERVELIKRYLTNRWQKKTKVNTSFIIWFKFLLGVPQGSAGFTSVARVNE